MSKLKETTFDNVVLGAKVVYEGQHGQKVDEPISKNRNKHGQDYNVMFSKGRSFLQKDTVVQTTYFSLKDEPEMRNK